MGLDQYGKIRNPETGEVTEIAYWRKHNALHGWMEHKYLEKNPDFEGDFNCIPLELTIEDLNELEKDVLGKNLPETNGFFFGSDSRYISDYANRDLEFIKNAKNALAEGMQVAYDSWW